MQLPKPPASRLASLAARLVAATTLAAAASLVLVWTGFTLSWRRYVPKRAKPSARLA